MNNLRTRKKELTRRAIVDAALTQLSPEQSFSGLSLREVAREAGLAPTSFYRHFKDMEELGLTLVDEAGLTLRQLMRQARKRIEDGGGVIRTSVETFMEFVSENENIFRLLLRERSGTSREFRAAVSRELAYFTHELTDYIKTRANYDRTLAHLEAETMVAIVFNAGANALDYPRSERKQIVEKTIQQLKLIDAGTRALQERRNNRG